MNKLQITLNESHIRNSVMKSQHQCAIALAVRDVCPDAKSVRVAFIDSVVIDGCMWSAKGINKQKQHSIMKLSDAGDTDILLSELGEETLSLEFERDAGWDDAWRSAVQQGFIRSDDV